MMTKPTIPSRFRKSPQKAIWYSEGYRDALSGRAITGEIEADLARHQGQGNFSAYKAGYAVGQNEKANDPDPATAEYEHIKRQHANRPEAHYDEPTNED